MHINTLKIICGIFFSLVSYKISFFYIVYLPFAHRLAAAAAAYSSIEFFFSLINSAGGYAKKHKRGTGDGGRRRYKKRPHNF